jgi:hypothetical protein
MRKLSNRTCRLMCLILTLLGLMSGLMLPGHPWNHRVSAQVVPVVANPSWVLTGKLLRAYSDVTA